MNIEWRFVEGSKNVYVSNDGQVKAVYPHREKIYKPYLRSGYCDVSVIINGKQMTCKAHRLVAQAFIPNPENKPQVNHKNKIKTDNRVENLEWVTEKEHAVHTLTFQPPNRGNNWVEVYCYDRYGKLIKKYKSIASVEEDGFIKSAVSACCRRQENSHRGLIWSFKELDDSYFKNLIIRYEGFHVKVYMYDKMGNLIKEYPSMLSTSDDGFTVPCVVNCCSGKLKTHKGFIFSREPLNKEYFSQRLFERRYCSKKVIQMDGDGNYIKTWDSVKQLKQSGFTECLIRACCVGIKKKHKGFTWRYEALMLIR